jgi:hypothetical protein
VRHLIEPWDESFKVKELVSTSISLGGDGYLNLIFFQFKKLNFLSTEILKL